MSEHNAAVDEWRPTAVTLTKPILHTEANRPESFLLVFLMVLIFIFEVSAAVVPVFEYTQTAVQSGVSAHVTIYHQRVDVCLSSSKASPDSNAKEIFDHSAQGVVCQTFSITDKLCYAMSSRVAAAGGFAVVTILVSVVGAISAVLEVRGKAFVSAATNYIFAGTLWALMFFEWILGSAAFEEHLCSNMSLKEIGFQYRAGWVLCFVAWLLLTLGMPFYVIRRRLRPVHYTTEEQSVRT